MRPEIEPPSPLYRSLARDSEFRLVILLPSKNFESVIECRLEHTILGNCRPFEALSYVWGEPHFTTAIILDGQEVNITPRLATALRHLRLPKEERALWIDAISIHQRDVAERQRQVGLMRNIYSSCSSDVLWLGPKNEVYSQAMEAVRKLAKLAMKHQGFGQKLKDHRKGVDSMFVWSGFRTLEKVEQADQALVEELLQEDPVWKRVWIMQELSCAPKVILKCGQDTLDWALVETVIQGGLNYTDAFHGPFGHHVRASDGWLETFSTAKVIANQRVAVRKMHEGAESSLLDVLARFKHTQSTDPRDKIYALLGLVSNTIGVKVDYTKSVADTYVGVALALINSSGNLDILCQCPWPPTNMIRGLPPLEDLPKWCPDFRTTQDGRFLFAQRGIFSAGRASCSVPCAIHERAILLNGHLLGRLEASKGMIIPNSKEQHITNIHEIVLRDWAYKNLTLDIQGVIAKHKYRNGEGQLQAFWRTLGADCSGYPQRRLTTDEIASDNKAVQALINAPDPGKHGFYGRIRTMFHRLVFGQDWRFYTSDNGLFVLAQDVAMAGDVVAVLDGAKVPMILRPTGETLEGEETYTPVSGAYVHGFMDGEALNPANEFQKKLFWVV